MDELLTTQELADYLRIPIATLYQWRVRQEGPRAFRVGRHLRWKRAEIDRWLDTQAERSL